METLFGINDVVICVDSTNTRLLTEGKKYTINAVMPCNCGKTYVDVGIVISDSGHHLCTCGHWHPSFKKAWYKETRFVKSEDNHQLEEEIFEAMKGVKIEN